MSFQNKIEMEIFTQTLINGKRQAVIIEYKVTKKEINRYHVILDDNEEVG